MKIANKYNHLNAYEYLIVNRDAEYDDIIKCINSIDANRFLKASCTKTSIGKVLYDQKKINAEFNRILNARGWKQKIVDYFVTTDEDTNRKIVFENEKDRQKNIIRNAGFEPLKTSNQVDFQKNEVAIEVQFGKYTFVAYDLHVKHTFFYARNEINVGIEIIPTQAMCSHMDAGVSWFENEVTNVMREGRTNPPVPIFIIGIEPDTIASSSAMDYPDNDYVKILQNSDISKMKTKINDILASGTVRADKKVIIEKIERCIKMLEA